MRDRERQHRPEGVHQPEEVGLSGQDREDGDAAEDQDPDPWRPVARMQPTQAVRELPVDAHRVHQARDADDRGVGRDEQDRGRQDADVELTGRLQRPEVDLLDDAEDRVAREAALVLGQAELGLILAVDLLDGKR